jgi:hypothetical protein
VHQLWQDTVVDFVSAAGLFFKRESGYNEEHVRKPLIEMLGEAQAELDLAGATGSAAVGEQAGDDDDDWGIGSGGGGNKSKKSKDAADGAERTFVGYPDPSMLDLYHLEYEEDCENNSGHEQWRQDSDFEQGTTRSSAAKANKERRHKLMIKMLDATREERKARDAFLDQLLVAFREEEAKGKRPGQGASEEAPALAASGEGAAGRESTSERAVVVAAAVEQLPFAPTTSVWPEHWHAHGRGVVVALQRVAAERQATADQADLDEERAWEAAVKARFLKVGGLSASDGLAEHHAMVDCMGLYQLVDLEAFGHQRQVVNHRAVWQMSKHWETGKAKDQNGLERFIFYSSSGMWMIGHRDAMRGGEPVGYIKTPKEPLTRIASPTPVDGVVGRCPVDWTFFPGAQHDGPATPWQVLPSTFSCEVIDTETLLDDWATLDKMAEAREAAAELSSLAASYEANNQVD